MGEQVADFTVVKFLQWRTAYSRRSVEIVCQSLFKFALIFFFYRRTIPLAQRVATRSFGLIENIVRSFEQLRQRHFADCRCCDPGADGDDVARGAGMGCRQLLNRFPDTTGKPCGLLAAMVGEEHKDFFTAISEDGSAGPDAVVCHRTHCLDAVVAVEVAVNVVDLLEIINIDHDSGYGPAGSGCFHIRFRIGAGMRRLLRPVMASARKGFVNSA